MAQELWPSRAKLLVPPTPLPPRCLWSGTRTLALEGQTSCATQEGAGRTGEDIKDLYRPVWLIVKSALPYNNELNHRIKKTNPYRNMLLYLWLYYTSEGYVTCANGRTYGHS